LIIGVIVAGATSIFEPLLKTPKERKTRKESLNNLEMSSYIFSEKKV
jgi:hypothetical protein